MFSSTVQVGQIFKRKAIEVRMPKKDLIKLLISITLHFCISTSVWFAILVQMCYIVQLHIKELVLFSGPVPALWKWRDHTIHWDFNLLVHKQWHVGMASCTLLYNDNFLFRQCSKRCAYFNSVQQFCMHIMYRLLYFLFLCAFKCLRTKLQLSFLMFRNGQDSSTLVRQVMPSVGDADCH